MENPHAAGVGPPRLLTIKDAAHLLGLSEQALRRIIRAGQIPITRLSARRTRIHVEDLDAYVEQHRTGAA